jgi:ABC-type histidine transport system ATPase subunit
VVEPDAGDVFIDGTPIGGHRDSAGKYHRMRESEVNRLRSRMPMVFQRFNLFQNRSVLGMILVTHEMGFARHTADTVCFFRDGRVLESGPPAEIFDNPRHQETRSFIRGMER